MAESNPQPNNVNLKFRRSIERERKLPPVSQAQNRAMQAAASGKSKIGIPKSVGEEFTDDLELDDVKKLPPRKAKPNRRLERARAAGLISDRQAAKLNRGDEE